MSEKVQVRVGQVWESMDPREGGRCLRVEAIEGEHAVCQRVARSFGRWSPVGRPTRILLRRLRPGSRGYRLVSGDGAGGGQ